MTVMVDEVIQWPTRIRCFKAGSCHLTTDSDLEELHVFAKKLGLTISRFRSARGHSCSGRSLFQRGSKRLHVVRSEGRAAEETACRRGLLKASRRLVLESLTTMASLSIRARRVKGFTKRRNSHELPGKVQSQCDPL